MLKAIKEQGSLLYNKLNAITVKVALILGLPFYAINQEPENLVLNPSFEEYTTCFMNTSLIGHITDWYNLHPNGSVGSFNECSTDLNYSVPNNIVGYQIAKSGKGYGVAAVLVLNQNEEILPDSREMFLGSLSSSLQIGLTYYYRFYVSRCDVSNRYCATNALDIALIRDTTGFENTLVDIKDEDILSNQKTIVEDTLNWTMIEGCFVADYPFEFFGVGSFRKDELAETKIYTQSSGFHYAAYYFDDFLIYQCDTCCPDQYPVEDYITVNNNLITQGETATFETFLNEGHTANLYLFDSAGRIVYNAKLNGTDNSHQVPNNLAAGVYHYAMVTSEKKKLGGKIVVL